MPCYDQTGMTVTHSKLQNMYLSTQMNKIGFWSLPLFDEGAVGINTIYCEK